MSSNKQSYDVIIIGAGASGLMCAITAAKRGRRVLVLEGSNKPGKKILMSGGGRCNFTNYYVDSDNYISHNSHFCKSALAQYTQWDFISWVQETGVAFHERDHGQLFCDESSKDILNMLLDACEQQQVTIQCHADDISISKQSVDKISSAYSVFSKGKNYQCESLVIATGGLSIPSMGASDFGYRVAKQFAMTMIAPYASLVPMTFSDHHKQIFSRLSGIALPVEASSKQRSFKEAMLFTHRGLSGPVILQLSNYWKIGETISINLLPDIDAADFFQQKKQHSKLTLKKCLAEFFPKSLIKELEQLFWSEEKDRPIAEISNQRLQEIASNLSSWQLKPSGTEGYRTAEVTMGGVDTNEVSSKTFEATKHQGLYFIGEVLDVTGHLGGYNFQWAWSSGYVAGTHV